METVLQGRDGSRVFCKEQRMTEKQFVNYYRCPYDGTEWIDAWSCCCNDMCPKCGTKDIQPYKSEEAVHTEEQLPTL